MLKVAYVQGTDKGVVNRKKFFVKRDIFFLKRLTESVSS
jgi:hypothetical protein